jgi:hypothetical protein
MKITVLMNEIDILEYIPCIGARQKSRNKNDMSAILLSGKDKANALFSPKHSTFVQSFAHYRKHSKR